ncbi:hypothetical protein [uncultured Chryseobacterium sp.]|uniref:hypothetical protein n=1 Tax=uncultured Chryseobacterium sp. TaxID=259322 RepID=UPI0025E2EA9A|nr:hypothetical protein [uncultured Chryseobacterium sp.]
MEKKKVLITGASIAGNTIAWWLFLQNSEVTVVEQAGRFREGGQNVDVRGAGREVLRRMNLEEKVLGLSTGELGTDWVDENNKVIARFAVEDIGDGPTAEMEILRGDLSKLIFESAMQRAQYRFGDRIRAVEQEHNGAWVTFGKGSREYYDMVIVAEGVGSSTRELLFPDENKARYMDLTVAYFAIPGKDSDEHFSRQYNTTGGRGPPSNPTEPGRCGCIWGFRKDRKMKTNGMPAAKSNF